MCSDEIKNEIGKGEDDQDQDDYGGMALSSKLQKPDKTETTLNYSEGYDYSSVNFYGTLEETTLQRDDEDI